MTRLRASAGLCAALLLTVPAFAKNICVQDSYVNYLVFVNAKAPKKPGNAASLQGYYVDTGASFPFSGSAIMRANGDVVIGVTVLATIAGGNYVRSMTMLGDASFDADGNYNDGDGAMDVAQSWTPIDCSSLMLP
jgi:hypothetical protein